MSKKSISKQFIDESKELYYGLQSSISQNYQQINVNSQGGSSTKPSSPNFSESEESLASISSKKIKKYSTDVSSTEEFILDAKPKRKQFGTNEEKKKFVDDYTRKLKTEICKNWAATGTCRFGDKCSFAHGKDQLQGKSHLHPNYKTKPCKKFFVKGICSYGNRCQYIHNATQLYENGFQDFLNQIYPTRLQFDIKCRNSKIREFLGIKERLPSLFKLSYVKSFNFNSLDGVTSLTDELLQFPQSPQ